VPILISFFSRESIISSTLKYKLITLVTAKIAISPGISNNSHDKLKENEKFSVTIAKNMSKDKIERILPYFMRSS
jgi:uncharacterized OsmC-like protein